MSNTEKFAKIFEIDGRQVLVTKDTNDDSDGDSYDCPEIRIRVVTDNGHSLTMNLTFNEGDEERRNEVFDSYDEDSARKLLSSNNELLRI